jgi:hypothetical protein
MGLANSRETDQSHEPAGDANETLSKLDTKKSVLFSMLVTQPGSCEVRTAQICLAIHHLARLMQVIFPSNEPCDEPCTAVASGKRLPQTWYT